LSLDKIISSTECTTELCTMPEPTSTSQLRFTETETFASKELQTSGQSNSLLDFHHHSLHAGLKFFQTLSTRIQSDSDATTQHHSTWLISMFHSLPITLKPSSTTSALMFKQSNYIISFVLSFDVSFYLLNTH
jgi:hypothetical protein